MDKELPIQCAISILGGLKPAADALGLNSYQTLQQWVKTRVPAERCPDVEKLTNGEIRCEQLRPDVNWSYLRAHKKTA